MRVLLVASALSFAAAASRAAYVVADASAPTGVRAAEGAKPANALAWGTYDAAALNATGWGLLTIAASLTEPNATLAAYAAGFLEGWLTVAEIETNARNTGSDAKNGKRLQKFIDDNWSWMTAQVAAHASADPYWAHVGTVVAQLAGMSDGQAAAGGRQTWAQLYQGLLNGGDMFNLGDLYGLSEEQERRTPALARSKASAAAPAGTRNDHCSAMVRLTPGAADIVVTHATWAGYESMGRMLKRYDLAFPSISGAAVPGRYTALSAFPGGMQYSSDDFYVLSSGLVSLETTIDNGNLTLAQQYASTQVRGGFGARRCVKREWSHPLLLLFSFFRSSSSGCATSSPTGLPPTARAGRRPFPSLHLAHIPINGWSSIRISLCQARRRRTAR